MKLLKHLFPFAVGACIAGAVHLQAQIYWDPAGANNGVGGTGTWGATSFNTAPDSSGTLTASSATTNDVFAGTAGVVSIASSATASSLTFNTSGYTVSDTGTATFSPGGITLGTGVTLTLSPVDTTSVSLAFVTGGTNFDFGGTTATSGDVLAGYLLSGAIISTPTIINTTSISNAGGAAGYSFLSSLTTAVTATITAPIANSSGVNTLLGTGKDSLASLVVSGVISGTSGVIIEDDLGAGGKGTVYFNALNTYTGQTLINNGGTGAVTMSISNTLPAATDLILGATSGEGSLVNLNGTTQTVASLMSNGGTGSITNSLSSSVATLNIAGSDTATGSYALVISDGSGQTSLVRSGTGTTTLSGANTYTGATIINGGTLAVNGSLATGSAVAVNSTGTLAGTGKVGGSVTVLSGGAISPAGAAIGTLTLGSNLTLNGGSAVNFEVGSSTASKIILSGTGLTLTGPASGQVTINLLNFSGTAVPGTYTLLSFTGSVTSATNWNVSDFNLVTAPALNGSYLSIGGSSGFDLQVNAIPEPGTYAGVFGVVALTGAAWSRRRRSRLDPQMSA